MKHPDIRPTTNADTLSDPHPTPAAEPSLHPPASGQSSAAAQGLIDRLLDRVARSEAAPVLRPESNAIGKAQALGDDTHDLAAVSGTDDSALAIRLQREERASLQRVSGLSTELEDVTEVEYRRLRLERVVLIAVYSERTAQGQTAAEHSLRELAALAETAGAQVLDGLLQRRSTPDPDTYLGKGKAHELADLVAALGADTVIADTELAPSQRRSLEDVVKVKVIDRTAVILDIFSQHAKSREGKAQVELAQLEYLLPRLRGWGESMSRQSGGQVGAGGAGMGSRGPGETKIELDRRRINTRMAKLRQQITTFGPAREAKRAGRRRNSVPSVAIVGYTNAGKSSLLNRLTGSAALVQNQLFATLDTTVRHSVTADGRHFTYTDTVGFVRNLPHQLVEAFRSTFEEISSCDLVLHIVDASHPDPAAQLGTVREVMAEVGAGNLSEIVVCNKIDLVDAAQRMVLHGFAPHSVFVSARTGEGLDQLQAKVADALPVPDREVTVTVPYHRGDLIAELHERNRVLRKEYVAQGTRVHAYVSSEMFAKLHPYLVPQP